MKRMRMIALLACVLAPLVPATGAEGKTTPKPGLVLTMSNFRYCAADSCTPLDFGYLRPGDAPIEGTDNPLSIIDVKSGTLVRWVYRDASCDMFSCGGHNIFFENGKPSGVKKGFAPSNKGATAINIRITQKKGTTIRYFCTVNGHYMTGMTGILNVI